VAAVASIIDGLLRDSVLDGYDLAKVLGTSRRSVARWQTTRSTPRRVYEQRLLELQAVADLLRRVLQEESARLWLRSPNAELGYEKPLEVIAEGHYRRVIGVILAMAEGVTA